MKSIFKLNQLATRTAMIFAAAAATATATAQVDPAASVKTVGPEAITALSIKQEATTAELMSKSQDRAASAARSLLGQAADTMNPDELEAAIADKVPGFAGWVHREDGKTVARMTRSSGLFPGSAGGNGGTIIAKDKQSWKSMNTPSAVFAKSLGADVNVSAALWDSRQLLNFKRKIFSMADKNGVIATSIDRESNRLDVTYNEELDAKAVQALTARLVAAGIPMAAIAMRAGELPRNVASIGESLRAQSLPLAGGAQFNFSTTSGGFVCSVGVPARINGAQGFVTASHCSESVYSNAANTQMTSPSGIFIGSETIDPAGRSCALADTLGCRESDALFVSGGPADAVDFGKIMFTNRGSLTVAGTVNVLGTLNYPSVGQTIYKTGRTTGTTSSRVARVCVDALVSASNGTYGALCSVEVNSSSFIAGGDSGSSIWTYNGSGAIVTGIVSYGSSNTGGFSPWGGLVKEFGTITVR